MKYLVSFDEINYYLGTEIEADTADEAIEKYQEMFDNGDIEINKSEIIKIKATEIK